MNKYMSIDPSSECGKKLEGLKGIKVAREVPQLDFLKNMKIPYPLEVDTIPFSDHIEKTEKYQEKSLEILESIKENTANLSMLVEMINQSNDKQDELLEIMTEILAIAKEKEKKEAESKLKMVMNKITNTVDNADSIIKLLNWAMLVYNTVTPMLQK